MEKSQQKIVLDPFCFKQFEASAGAARIDFDQDEFTQRANDFYLAVKDKGGLKEGYAPFCKHLFIENFTNTYSTAIEITPENEKYLKSGYNARRETELAVLERWFEKKTLESEGAFKEQKARFLDLILYSKEQVQEENKDMGTEDPNKDIDYDYALISVKAQDQDHESPMQPITMLRNSLGKDQGGSGVKLEQDKYKESVAFWSKYATLK